jgi:hypothetical protein
MGRYKWKTLGLDYALDATLPPSIELIERTVAIFATEGLKAY